MFKHVFFFLALLFHQASTYPQHNWTKINAPDNPVVTDSFPRGYPGTAWVDFNNDGLLDLFVNNDYLFSRLPDGNFSKNLSFKGQTSALKPPNGVIGSGSSWADYDNDGDLDMFIASGKSFLFQNIGGGQFLKITSGAIGDSIGNRGWTCAWGDYDNDGNVDLLVVHPAGFVPTGNAIPNILFHNDGPPNYSFSKVTGFEFLSKLAPYTVATWSDYDLDGDIDLFIGSGPAGTAAKDYLYKNTLIENGIIGFERITAAPIGADLQDGQVYNWIDFDNDGDLDAFLTNYGGAPNRFYKNDQGVFTNIAGNMALAGVSCLANSWGDFDNNGYLDVVITSESKTYYFKNNGDGIFTEVTNALTISAAERGVSLGDYDNDGDLDAYISGLSPGNGLFRNDNSNGNNWLKLKLIGIESNKAAIGAKVKIKSTIGGAQMWQFREISAQNSFNSQNSLEVHFGLAEAVNVDSLLIFWPSGKEDILLNVTSNQLLIVSEGISTDLEDQKLKQLHFSLGQNYPNPFNPSTKISYEIAKETNVSLKVYDAIGNEVATLVNETKTPGAYEVIFNAANLSNGVYFYKIQAGNFTSTKKLILMK